MARDDTVAADAARVATLAGGGSVQEAARAAGRSSSSGLAVALRSGGLAARVGKLERLARAHGGDCAACRGRVAYVNDWRGQEGEPSPDPGPCPACGREPSIRIEYVSDWRQQGGDGPGPEA